MNANERRIFKILKRNSPSIKWDFVPVGRQAVQRPPFGAWVSYPDFEGRNDKKVVMLVESKGYDGWFYGVKVTIV